MAKSRNIANPPATRMLIVEEKMDSNLMPIIKMSRNVMSELLSIIPGDPAVHFTALIQTTIQIMRKRSPGNTRDCCNPKMEKFQVYASNGMLKMERFVRFINEKAMTLAANIWYRNCILAGRMSMSSNVAPIIRIPRAIIIGNVKLSILKKTKIAINAGIVIANPPNAGVIPSCNAFNGLSKSLPFFCESGLYVMSYFNAICPIIGVRIRASNAPIMNIGRYFRYFSNASPAIEKSKYSSNFKRVFVTIEISILYCY